MRRILTVPTLALTALLGSASVAQPTAEQGVNVELSSFKFTPAVLNLQLGTSYRLHLVNRSSGGHNFMAKEFFAHSTIAAEDQSKVEGGKVDVHGGEVVEIRVVPNVVGSMRREW